MSAHWRQARTLPTSNGMETREGLAVVDLVCGLYCPLPVKLYTLPATAEQSTLALMPCFCSCPSCRYICSHALWAASGRLQWQVPTRTYTAKQKNGSSCVWMPALAGDHPDVYWKTKQRPPCACCPRRHGPLPLSSATVLASALVRRVGNCSLHGRRHNDLLPNVISSNSAISACVRGGQRQHAFGLLCGDATQRFLLPNVISNSSAISACEKGGQWQQALGLLVRTSSTAILASALARRLFSSAKRSAAVQSDCLAWHT